MTGEPVDETAELGGPATESLLGIGEVRESQAGVDAEPAQRLGLPGGGAVPHPGQVGDGIRDVLDPRLKD